MRNLITGIVLILIASSVFGQEITVDKRAYGYYTQNEINKMPKYKIKQINFLYQHSFTIPDEFKGQINPNDIDIRQYSKQRLPHSRAKVFLKTQGDTQKERDNFTGQYIYLLSIDELREAYENIKH